MKIYYKNNEDAMEKLVELRKKGIEANKYIVIEWE
jgi:hypothetical protein